MAGNRYNLESPGAAFSQGIQEALMQRELQRRQELEEKLKQEEALREQARMDQAAKAQAEDLALRKAAGARADKQFGFDRAVEAEKHRMPGIISRASYESVKDYPELLGDVTVNPGGEFQAEGPLSPEQETAGESLGSFEVPEEITSEGGSKFQADRQVAEEREYQKQLQIASNERIAREKIEADAKEDARRAEDRRNQHNDRMANERARMEQNWRMDQMALAFRKDPWIDGRMKEIMARYEDEMRMNDALLNADKIDVDEHARRTTNVMSKREAEVRRLSGNMTESNRPDQPRGGMPGEQPLIKAIRDPKTGKLTFSQ